MSDWTTKPYRLPRKTCAQHPERPAIARGLCRQCYDAARRCSPAMPRILEQERQELAS